MSQQGEGRPNFETTRHLAYAEASLMLIESMLQLLIERGVLSRAEVVEAVETVLEAKKINWREGNHPDISAVAAGVVSTLANSVAAGEKGTPSP
jgi:hypothetical protein